MEPLVSSAVRTPRLCCTRGLMVTPASCAASSAYTGTSGMSMNGDLPGLSNFWPGTMGSCQYNIFLSVGEALASAFCMFALGAELLVGAAAGVTDRFA